MYELMGFDQLWYYVKKYSDDWLLFIVFTIDLMGTILQSLHKYKWL